MPPGNKGFEQKGSNVQTRNGKSFLSSLSYHLDLLFQFGFIEM